MSENMIKAFDIIYNSKRNKHGNCNYYVVIFRTSDGKWASGHISGNMFDITCALSILFNKDGYHHYVCEKSELSIREYNRRFMRDTKYLGCTLKEINKNILKQLNK